MIPFAVGLFVLEELRKGLVRRTVAHAMQSRTGSA